jgi:glyoxylase-like metal-dependent hydrolase (beta-lactamase superfamily II)
MERIPFIREFAFEYAVLETLSPMVRRIVARNPGPFTGPGTSTFVIGHGRVALIEPGPALEAHVAAVLHALRGETIEHIFATHTHLDHAPAAAAIKAATGASIYGFDPHAAGPGHGRDGRAECDFMPDRIIGDGDSIEGSGWRLTAIHTPGHASNHLCFALDEERVLFTGDHVMGWSTTVVSPPDGDMAAYRRSLAKLQGRDDRLWIPTHGPAISDPQPFLATLIEHRRARSEAVLARLKAGDRTIPELVEAIYRGRLAPALRQAAGRSLLSHLIELIERELVVQEDDRYRPA